MDTFLGRFKNLIVLAAILFAQIVGLAIQVRRPTQQGETRLIRLWAVSAVTPFESAIVHSQHWVHGVWTNYAYLRGVRRENRELRAEIARMKIDQARISEDALMARRVQALLAFKQQYVDSTVAAQVIGTSGSDQSRVLYIDKGSRDGLSPDMAVITPTGIVGKISQVYPDSSQVLPINDQFSGVGAALKDSRLQGILKGGANGATTLQYIMSDERVVPGEEVITSGGDRIFPKGLPVGKVASVAPGKDLFLNIRVIPAAHLDRLEEVLVVTKITEKAPDPQELGPLRASDILAQRLPGVPNQAGIDAAGNKAEGPPGAPATATTSTTAHPSSLAPNNASKPAVRSVGPAAKPAVSTPTTAGNKPITKPKPPEPVGTAAEAAPNGGAAATSKPAEPADAAGTEPKPDTSAPVVAPDATTTRPTEQPSTAPLGVPPQQ